VKSSELPLPEHLKAMVELFISKIPEEMRPVSRSLCVTIYQAGHIDGRISVIDPEWDAWKKARTG